MKILSLSSLGSIPFYVREVSVIQQRPLWSTLGGLGGNSTPRRLNGFLLVREGRCHYRWEGGDADLGAGDLIYLPSGARRQVNTLGDEQLSFFRICFRLFDASDGEEVLFSERPYVVREVRQRAFELCERMHTTTLSSYNTLETLAALCELLAVVGKQTEKPHNSRVLPAIRYVEAHYHEEFDVAHLAELCYMSQPHLFRTFKQETGRTPLEYRTALRIERARALLAGGECRVGEVADMLGFESVYYFSRIFKKWVGVSPSEYQQKNE